MALFHCSNGCKWSKLALGLVLPLNWTTVLVKKKKKTQATDCLPPPPTPPSPLSSCFILLRAISSKTWEFLFAWSPRLRCDLVLSTSSGETGELVYCPHSGIPFVKIVQFGEAGDKQPKRVKSQGKRATFPSHWKTTAAALPSVLTLVGKGDSSISSTALRGRPCWCLCKKVKYLTSLPDLCSSIENKGQVQKCSLGKSQKKKNNLRLIWQYRQIIFII